MVQNIPQNYLRGILLGMMGVWVFFFSTTNEQCQTLYQNCTRVECWYKLTVKVTGSIW